MVPAEKAHTSEVRGIAIKTCAHLSESGPSEDTDVPKEVRLIEVACGYCEIHTAKVVVETDPRSHKIEARNAGELLRAHTYVSKASPLHGPQAHTELPSYITDP